MLALLQSADDEVDEYFGFIDELGYGPVDKDGNIDVRVLNRSGCNTPEIDRMGLESVGMLPRVMTRTRATTIVDEDEEDTVEFCFENYIRMNNYNTREDAE